MGAAIVYYLGFIPAGKVIGQMQTLWHTRNTDSKRIMTIHDEYVADAERTKSGHTYMLITIQDPEDFRNNLQKQAV